MSSPSRPFFGMYLVAPRPRIEAEPDHAEPQFVAHLAHLTQVLVHLLAGLVHGLQGRAAQLELAARFEGDRTSRVVFERDDAALFDDRLPAEAGHALQQRADPVRPVIGNPAQIGAAEDEFLVLGADPPGFGRLVAGFVIRNELPLIADRRSCYARWPRHAAPATPDRRNSFPADFKMGQRGRVRRQSPAIA